MKIPRIKISDSKSGGTTIDIEGTIGVPEEWQFEEPAGRVATFEAFQKTLAAISKIKGGEIVVNIRSGGGDVGDALLIYDALAALVAREGTSVTTRCRGYVASAATIIAQAASPGCREVSSSSLYLIHNAVGNCEGNATDFRQNEELLAKTDERIASIYASHSGRDAAEFSALMGENNGAGRWLSPEETLAAGLADKIVGTEAPKRKKPERLPTNSGDADLLRFGKDIELEKLRFRIATLESDNAQLKARPTDTKQKEDPALTESRRSANDDAYQRDAEKIFNQTN